MRASLVPQLLAIAKKHINNQQPHLNFYETGFVYGHYPENIYPTQQLIFTAISTNPTLLLKILYHFTQSNELKAPISKNTSLATWQESGTSFWAQEHKLALCGKIKHNLTKTILDEDYYAIEIFPDALIHLEKKTYPKPSLQTTIYKDISFALPANMPINQLIEILLQNKYDFEIFDIYPNENLNKLRNYGIRFKFNLSQSITKTELNEKIEGIKTLVMQTLNISTN